MKLLSALFFILSISAPTISYCQDDSNNYLLHAESSERLTTIMRRLFSITHEERIEENLSLTKADANALSEAVEELLFYAELMSAKVPATELEENQHVVFNAMANQLYDESYNIKQLVKNYDFDIADSGQEQIIYTAFERLNRTCAACHQLFRDK
jgi:hypothetical protein